jgi:hypothetical protein
MSEADPPWKQHAKRALAVGATPCRACWAWREKAIAQRKQFDDEVSQDEMPGWRQACLKGFRLATDFQAQRVKMQNLSRVPRIFSQDPRFIRTCDMAMFSVAETDRLWKIFNKIDSNSNQFIEMSEYVLTV